MTTLLLASTGGHLAQLHQLRPRLVDRGEDVVWATFDTPQSRSLLAGERVEYLPYVAPRDWRNVLGNVSHARRVLSYHDVRRLFTTGSGVALSFLPTARARGVPCHYIESAARSQGPSVTGRVAAMIPGVRTYTQYACWEGGRWRRSVSVFDDFVAEVRVEPVPVRRVVVMLGTIQGYGFRGLVERLCRILPPGTDVLWQTGDTDVTGLPIEARPALPFAELAAAVQRADVVVAHAGVGSALSALTQGKLPVLVPRRSSRAEHVDDHQVQIAAELSTRGLAFRRELHDLTLDDLQAAARYRVSRVVHDDRPPSGEGRQRQPSTDLLGSPGVDVPAVRERGPLARRLHGPSVREMQLPRQAWLPVAPLDRTAARQVTLDSRSAAPPS